jgi:hypothetical protein
MRAFVATFAGLVALNALSAQAAPLPPAKAGLAALDATRPIELAAQGCGYGYRHIRGQDQWGSWHWSRCVPKS